MVMADIGVTYDRPGPTLAAIRDAAREYVASEGGTDVNHSIGALSRRLGVPLSPRTSSEWKLYDRFRGQVRSALNQLAEAGELCKVGKDRTGPEGYQFTYGSDPHYYTPAAYEQAKTDDRAVRAQRDFERERNERLWDDLEALGYPPLGDRRFEYGKPPQLSPDRMAGLITLAKAERARRESHVEVAEPGSSGGGGGRG
jgi:hypothetical protein